MRGLYTGLSLWNVLVLTAFAVLSIVQGMSHPFSDRAFQLLAVFSGVFCCLVHSLLVIHFIGSMKWMEQSGPTAGIDNTRTLRRAWIKGLMFPLLICGMLLAVAVAIISGGSQFASIPSWIPIGLAFLSVAVNAAVIPFARKGIAGTRTRMNMLNERMETRVAAGDVPTDDGAELLPESGRAGGKTIMFLAANVWLLYAYNRFILRDRMEPIWPYAIAFGALLLVGFALMRRYDDTAANPTAGDS